MDILVTGGAGFIGQKLVKSLLLQNNNIFIFDNFSNSLKDQLDLSQKNLHLVEGDIVDYNSIKNALVGIDLVIHLAAQINVNASFLDPDFTNKVNVLGTENLLKACVENKIKNIIISSSAAVFGESKNLPLIETSELSPISPYGESKAAMEKLIKNYVNKFSFNCIILRFFNIFGKGQNDEYAGVITKFLKQINLNKKLIIFGDGNQTRDFIYIDDIIHSIEHAIENVYGKRATCYNIGSGINVSIKELANLMISISGKDLEIEYLPKKDGDIKYSITTIDLAKKELNFIPKITLENGLKHLIKN
jgi:UDP-glucose 4-epimerase